MYTNPGTRALVVDKTQITPDVLILYLKKMIDFDNLKRGNKLDSDLFPLFIVKYGYSMGSNTVKLFYSIK